MKAYRFWSEEDTALALKMRADGVPVKDIAKHFGRSFRSTEQFLYRVRGGFHKLGRTCEDCSAPIRDACKNTTCRACTMRRLNYDQEFNARRLEALRNSPLYMGPSPKRSEASRKAARKRLSNPQYRAYLEEFMRSVVQPAGNSPEARAKIDYKASGRKISETRMAWCPHEYRELYKEIKAKLTLAEAKAIVLEQIRIDRERMSPFERQMRALKKGAQLVANDTAPSLASPGDFGERRWIA